ncbi:MAG: hypothetical protein ABI857_09010 [Acidobacteriota bacterium]
MEKNKKIANDREDLFDRYRDEITPAYQRAVREALLGHKKAGNSVAVSKDGKVVILQPEEIDLD